MRFRFLSLVLAFQIVLIAHAPPTYLPVAPVKVRANTLVDAIGVPFALRGVEVTDPELVSTFTFRVIQQRWNMNAVRFPASLSAWLADEEGYLGQLRETVEKANAEQLLVVLVLKDDREEPAGLPDEAAERFWRACASQLREHPRLIFDLYSKPHDPERNWALWFERMQALVAAIRGASAEQVIAAASFDDPLDFQGFSHYLTDPSILYESHLYFDHASTDEARDANLGFLAARFPLYVGAWGMPFDQPGPACEAVPVDTGQAVELLLQTLVYYDLKSISWTASGFRKGSLIRDTDELHATTLNNPWTCGEPGSAGMGEYLLLWMTGDPAGFGSLAVDQIASVAGGAALPVAPGQIVAIYGQLLGPETAVSGHLDDGGRMPTALGDVRVTFEGVDAPVTLAGYFQVNVQVPYGLREKAEVQLHYRGVPSNRITLTVVEAAPGLLTSTTRFGEAAVTNENGSSNTNTQPAAQGSLITVLATGVGETAPPSQTGVAAVAPLAAPALPVLLSIGTRSAEVLAATAAPGMIGLLEIRARVPEGLPAGPVKVPIVVTVGSRASRPEVTMWIR